MRNNLYGFAQVCTLLIALAPLVWVNPNALKHAVGAYLFFLPIARGWQRFILAKMLPCKVKDILVDLSSCDVALELCTSIGPYELLDFFQRTDLRREIQAQVPSRVELVGIRREQSNANNVPLIIPKIKVALTPIYRSLAMCVF